VVGGSAQNIGEHDTRVLRRMHCSQDMRSRVTAQLWEIFDSTSVVKLELIRKAM
jgi:hypothetical protein